MLEHYPGMGEVLNELTPKKGTPVYTIKCQQPRGTLYAVNDVILFVQPKNDIIYPTLRIAMAYPGMMPTVTADKGAIRAILKGSNVMVPGFTSAGGSIEGDIPLGAPVAVHVEGKLLPIAVGKMAMSVADVRAADQGIAVTTVAFLNDGLWKEEK